jgi:subtilisin family serine protease
MPLTQADTMNLPPGSPDDIRIAIIDTGVDFTHPALQPFIRRKPSNCYAEDPIGRNFVHDNNNSQDDHSHGTHVAGILARTLLADANSCNYHIVPYKTHDAQGVSSLFDVTCATYQAVEDKVSVINDSWGFYGDSSVVLRNAVDTAAREGILIVSSAGNDSLLLDTLLQYPACYVTPNRLTVGAYQDVDQPGGIARQLAAFSNRSTRWVDIAAPGVDIQSAVPNWYQMANPLRTFKSGTSMATPAVTAAAAISYCERPGDYEYPKARVLDCARSFPGLQGDVRESLALNLDLPCLTPTDDIPVAAASGLTLYPNPTYDSFWLRSTQALGSCTLRLYAADGRLLRQQANNELNAGSELWINMSELPAGLYWLEVQTETERWVEKVVRM